MQFVKTGDLKPGMRLAKPIYNKMGVMLYERDTKLNAQGIESIKNFNLIGIYILEPAEPVPPLSEEDLAFEQFQTISMFQLRTCMDQILNNTPPTGLNELVNNIIANYGSLDHKLNFTQNLRSSSDFTYKHAISTAILSAMISNTLGSTHEIKAACVTAALLYDIGYLLVPQDILDKGNRLSPADQRTIQECRKLGFEKLNPGSAPFLEQTVLKMISQVIYVTNPADREPEEKISLFNGSKLLKVADTFDRMTAMSLDKEPVSEIIAIRHLFNKPEQFDSRVVNALSTSINILPAGCCIDITGFEKAMVLMENPDNFMQPLILKFSDNRIYDLRDPEVNQEIQVLDIMKTMDNRIMVDEATLKHFYADDVIKKAADDFHRKREELIRKGRYDDSPANKSSRSVKQSNQSAPSPANAQKRRRLK